jgi:hypothetical protein
MDKLRFQLTAQWVAELLSDPKFNKELFNKYVDSLMKNKEVAKYPVEIEAQNEDLIKNSLF